MKAGLIAGVAAFLSTIRIIFLQPAICFRAGMDFGSVMVTARLSLARAFVALTGTVGRGPTVGLPFYPASKLMARIGRETSRFMRLPDGTFLVRYAGRPDRRRTNPITIYRIHCPAGTLSIPLPASCPTGDLHITVTHLSREHCP